MKKLSELSALEFVLATVGIACSVIVIIAEVVFDFGYRNRHLLLPAAVAFLCISLPGWVFTAVDETVPVFKGNTYAEARRYVYVNCHEMTNNFIVAEDGKIRGFVRADRRNIDRIISVVAQYSLPDGVLLVRWLTALRNDDYSEVVTFHNYCWERLNGEVGYAIDIKSEYR